MRNVRNSLTLAIAVGFAVQAHAEDRTASWFAAHPKEMNAVLDACRDDPGHLKHDPNCANASQGMLQWSADRERAQFLASVDEMNAQEEQTWRANPVSLLARLKACNAATLASQRQTWHCDRAFAIAQQMTGHRQ
jgi:hypothetical protein